ncbi:DNA adenine methylase [Nitrospina gracilis]|uniref:DNA adenine methylase n=1 Tax=Nitrospina gracilis TaxID=35801 RepID=UPI00235151B7|nr:DNA adenine methylase [Nitrospina gracilis]MCF8719199.1 site-specific DNA-adenine methylase [Nitrospina gracilis Nb-211]
MKSFISWVGGKSRLAASIVELFPPHRTYVEVFGGAAWVLFRKDASTSKVEVYNDIHGELVNLFRVVKHRPSALVECFRMALFSRQTYYRFLKELDQPAEDEVERAARFLFLIRSAFGSSIGQGWGVQPHTAGKAAGGSGVPRCSGHKAGSGVHR